MSQQHNTGRDPSAKDLAEAKRIAALDVTAQRQHPAAVPSDISKLTHINTYGDLPTYYTDKPFRCRDCGKEEIWRAADQKWYYEEAKGHIDATAVRCRACRVASSPRNNRLGRTLTELLVVIAIIATLVSLFAPAALKVYRAAENLKG